MILYIEPQSDVIEDEDGTPAPTDDDRGNSDVQERGRQAQMFTADTQDPFVRATADTGDSIMDSE